LYVDAFKSKSEDGKSSVEVVDAKALAYAPPIKDEALSSENNVEIMDSSTNTKGFVVVFKRKLVTGDNYDFNF